MKELQVVRKAAKVRSGVLFLVVGLIMTVIGGIVVFTPPAERVEVTATIQSIESIGFDSEGNEEYEVLVTYTDADGKLHKGVQCPSYDSSMKVGDTVQVLYDANNPELLSSTGMEWFPYLIVVLGLGCIVFAIMSIVRTVKTKAADTDPLDRVDAATVDPQTVEAIKNSNEPTAEYYFHYTGKLNQSYILETPARTPIFEAVCDRIGVARAYLFTFKDHNTGKEESHEVTHTLTTEQGGNGFSLITSSAFKIDKVDNWDYLGKLGYSLEPHREGIKFNFDLLHYGVKVGELKAAGTNILRDDEGTKLGDKLPGNGLYKVYCRASDIEGAFVACFCLSRVESI